MNWVERVKNADYSSNIDDEKMFRDINHIREFEPALMNPVVVDSDGVSPSIICRQDGKIEIFAASNLGIRIDPANESIVFFAPYIHFVSSEEINFRTKARNGMKWNKFPIKMTPIHKGATATGIPVTTEGTLSPVNTTAQDLAKYMNRMLSNIGGG